MKTTFIAIVFLFSTILSYSQHAGDYDSSFAGDGILRTDLGKYSEGKIVKVRSDGKIITGISVTNGFALMRYKSNGSIDSSFGINGIDTSAAQLKYNTSIALQPDNKIIVVSTFYSTTTSADSLWVARCKADGGLDTSFGENGFSIANAGYYSKLLATVLQPDGKIIAAGTSNNNQSFVLVRLKTNGNPDSSFGIYGTSISSAGGFTNISALALQPNGKIIAAGDVGGVSPDSIMIARFQTNGDADPTFGVNGIVRTVVATRCFANAVVVQTDGKIVASGSLDSITINKAIVMRYDTNGNLDISFGKNGVVQSVVDGGIACYSFSLALQKDGKIITAGTCDSAYHTGPYKCAVSRFNTNGSIDTSFGNGGSVATWLAPLVPSAGGGPNSVFFSVAIQPDGKIVALGTDLGYHTSYYIHVLIRYLSDSLKLGILNFEPGTNDVLVYPNPIGQRATLSYNLPTDKLIDICLTDLQGRTIMTFTNREKQAKGEHKKDILLPEELPAGIYFIVLSSPNGRISVKIVK